MMPVRLRKAQTRTIFTERRKYPRLNPSVIPHLKEIRLVGGPEAVLLNISLRGAMFESEARLGPGAHLSIRIVTADAILKLRGRVVYSKAVLLKGSVLRYRSAIEFDEDFPLADARLTGQVMPTVNEIHSPDPPLSGGIDGSGREELQASDPVDSAEYVATENAGMVETPKPLGAKTM